MATRRRRLGKATVGQAAQRLMDRIKTCAREQITLLLEDLRDVDPKVFSKKIKIQYSWEGRNYSFSGLLAHGTALQATRGNILKLVIDRSPNNVLSRRDSLNNLPLHRAVRNPNLTVDNIRWLHLRDPHAIQTPGNGGRLPLHHAAFNGALDVDTLRYLLSVNQDAAVAVDTENNLPLHLFVRNHSGLTRQLLTLLVETRTAPLAQAGNTGRIALHWAGFNAHMTADVLRYLIDMYPDGAGTRDTQENLPLHVFACFHPCTSDPDANNTDGTGSGVTATPSRLLLSILVEAFPDAASERGSNGDFVLHHVSRNATVNEEVLTYVLQLHPEAAALENNKGELPLHLLAKHAPLSRDLLAVLIDAHPDAIQTSDGTCGALPLHFAAQNSTVNTDIVRYMLELHRDAVLTVNKDGDLPLHVFLQTYKRFSPPPMSSAAAANAPTFARNSSVSGSMGGFGLTRGSSMGSEDTPLSSSSSASPSDPNGTPSGATGAGDVRPPPEAMEVLRLLVDANPDALNSCGKNGGLPLHCIAANSSANAHVVEYLWEQNPTAARAEDRNRDTFLHIVARAYLSSRQEGRTDQLNRRAEIIRYIVERDPQLLVQVNKKREMPLLLLSGTPVLDRLGFAAIPDYVRTEKLLSMRVHLCGDEGVGKTSLRAWLTEDSSLLARLKTAMSTTSLFRESRTLGAEITPVQLRRHDSLWNSFVSFVAQSEEEAPEPILIFDHGGQTRFHVMHTSIFSGQRSVFVLVIPTAFPFGEGGTGQTLRSESEDDWRAHAGDTLQRWLSLIDTVAHPDSYVIVLCNQWSAQSSDEGTRRANLLELDLRDLLMLRSRTSPAVAAAPATGEGSRSRSSAARVSGAAGEKAEIRASPGRKAKRLAAVKSLPTVHEKLIRVNMNPDKAEVEEFQETLHTVCSDLRKQVLIPSLCVEAANVVRSMRHDKSQSVVSLKRLSEVMQAHFGQDSVQLAQKHVASLVRFLEQCGEVMCLDAPKSGSSAREPHAEERIVIDPHFFCNKILGQLFSHEMWGSLNSRARRGLAAPFDVRAGHNSEYIVSAQTMNSWVTMPAEALALEDDTTTATAAVANGSNGSPVRGQLQKQPSLDQASVADALFGGSMMALPKLLCSMGWCARVDSSLARSDSGGSSSSSSSGKRTPSRAKSGSASHPQWIPLFLLDDLVLKPQDVRRALKVGGDNAPVWVRIGRRVSCSSDSQTVLSQSFMRMQAQLLSHFVQPRGASNRGKRDEDGRNWSVFLWSDGVLLSRHASADNPHEQTSVLVRHVWRGEVAEWGRTQAVDVYVTGSLHTVPDWQACCSGANGPTHRLQSLVEDIVDGIVVRTLTADRVPSEVEALRMSDALLVPGIPEVAGGAMRGHVVYGNPQDLISHTEARVVRRPENLGAPIALLPQSIMLRPEEGSEYVHSNMPCELDDGDFVGSLLPQLTRRIVRALAHDAATTRGDSSTVVVSDPTWCAGRDAHLLYLAQNVAHYASLLRLERTTLYDIVVSLHGCFHQDHRNFVDTVDLAFKKLDALLDATSPTERVAQPPLPPSPTSSTAQADGAADTGPVTAPSDPEPEPQPEPVKLTRANDLERCRSQLQTLRGVFAQHVLDIEAREARVPDSVAVAGDGMGGRGTGVDAMLHRPWERTPLQYGDKLLCLVRDVLRSVIDRLGMQRVGYHADGTFAPAVLESTDVQAYVNYVLDVSAEGRTVEVAHELEWTVPALRHCLERILAVQQVLISRDLQQEEEQASRGFDHEAEPCVRELAPLVMMLAAKARVEWAQRNAAEWLTVFEQHVATRAVRRARLTDKLLFHRGMSLLVDAKGVGDTEVRAKLARAVREERLSDWFALAVAKTNDPESPEQQMQSRLWGLELAQPHALFPSGDRARNILFAAFRVSPPRVRSSAAAAAAAAAVVGVRGHHNRDEQAGEGAVTLAQLLLRSLHPSEPKDVPTLNVLRKVCGRALVNKLIEFNRPKTALLKELIDAQVSIDTLRAAGFRESPGSIASRLADAYASASLSAELPDEDEEGNERGGQLEKQNGDIGPSDEDDVTKAGSSGDTSKSPASRNAALTPGTVTVASPTAAEISAANQLIGRNSIGGSPRGDIDDGDDSINTVEAPGIESKE